MNLNIIIALLGGIINMILSIIIPYFFKKDTEQSINTIYKKNRQLIIISSLIVALTIFITLSIGPNFDDMIASLFKKKQIEPQIINLSNLMNPKSTMYDTNTRFKIELSELSSSER